MSTPLYGIIMIVGGVLYILRPNLFRLGLWRKTALSQQIFTPKQYVIYMRILGSIAILIGAYLLVRFYK